MVQLILLYNFANVFRHYEYVKARLFGLPVCPSAKDILIIGISMMNMILLVIPLWGIMLFSNKLHFDNKDLLQLLPDGVTNPCVTGFVIEYVVDCVERPQYHTRY